MPEYLIASYNAENFFATADGKNIGEAKTPKAVNAMVRVINDLQADFIAFQEIENELALSTLNAALESPYEYFAVIKGNYYRGLHLAALSRYPFTCLSHAQQLLHDNSGKRLFEYASPDAAKNKNKTGLRLQRDVLLLEVDLPGIGNTAIFNHHLKSQNNTNWHLLDHHEKRTAECVGAKKIIDAFIAANPNTAVIVLGDFNATVEDASIQALTAGFVDALERDWIAKDKKPHYSFNSRAHKKRIDYILLSAVAEKFYLQGSAAIHGSRQGKRASDHYPVSIRLKA